MGATRTGSATRGLSLKDRFLFHVETSDGCWKWRGKMIPNDHRGLFRVGDRWLKAHNAAKLALHNEERPEGHDAHHTCLNGACVNPDHIIYLTRAAHQAEHRRLRKLGSEE